MPAVLSDGTVAFSFYDFATPRGNRLLRMRRLWVATSADGGRTLSSPFFVTEITDHWMFTTLAVDPLLGGGVSRPALHGVDQLRPNPHAHRHR